MDDVFRHLSWKLILQVMILLFSVFSGIETKADPTPTDPATSTVSASPESVPADGTSNATITVTLLDTNGNPVHGHTVMLDDGLATSTITSASDVSNPSGQVRFTVTNTTVGLATYTATDTQTNIKIMKTANVAFTGPPTITFQPQSNEVTEPDPAQFTVEAKGKEPLTYEWHIDQIVPTGENDNALVLNPTNSTTHHNAKVYVVVKDADGQEVKSTEVELRVKQDPDNCPHPYSINLKLTSVGVGLGGTWGHGTLAFSRKDENGKTQEDTYYFSARGFNFTDVGVARINSSGSVCGLTDISQFSGTYGGIGSDLALAGGIGISRFWNQHGIVLKLRESLQGIHFGFAGKSLVLTIN